MTCNADGFVVAAPCFIADGTPDATCEATSIANPYWNAPVQGRFDPNAQYGAIRDPYTHGFDATGAFREPAQLIGNVRLSYELTTRVEIVATLANVVNHCCGGQKTAFTYNLSPASMQLLKPYQRGRARRQHLQSGRQRADVPQYPYEPTFGSYNAVTGVSLFQPFSAYVSVRVKL